MQCLHALRERKLHFHSWQSDISAKAIVGLWASKIKVQIYNTRKYSPKEIFCCFPLFLYYILVQIAMQNSAKIIMEAFESRKLLSYSCKGLLGIGKVPFQLILQSYKKFIIQSGRFHVINSGIRILYFIISTAVYTIKLLLDFSP